MKKAAIISIYGNYNYGNKLQNYAVQEVLKKHNLDVTNIINIPLLNNKSTSRVDVIKFYIKGFLKKIIYGVNIYDQLDVNDSKERQKNFLEFNKYINNSKEFFSFNHLNELKDYDYFFVGSDQIWNPNYGGLSDFDLLTFTDKTKISFSASFGISKIPIEYNKKLKNELFKFKSISVREDSGKKIIENVVGRDDVEVLIDPTMMLTTKEWDKVSKKPKNLKDEKYILCYFLGGLSPKRKSKIEKLANDNDCIIIDLFDESNKFYYSGPSEFIYLESHAKYICTDSFHSSVFAILYNIPFIVFDREGKYNNMNSRINTLLNKFKIEKQLYDRNVSKDLEWYLDTDFKEANKLLISEKKKADDFLRKNIE